MGLVKLDVNQVAQADGILQLTADISSNTLTIDVIYALDMGSNKLAKANVVYTKGASNSFTCLLYTSPSPRDRQKSRMPSSA